jgi:uncharacterized protein (TIGR02284 family)
MGIRDVVSGHRDHATISETERGEHVAVEAYDDALQGMLSPRVRDVIENQLAELRHAHERVRALDQMPARL